MTNFQSQFDFLNIIYEEVEHSVSHVINSRYNLSKKIQHVQMYLCKFKSEIFQWIHNLVNIYANSQQEIKKIKQKLLDSHSKSRQELIKHKLHIILKKKLNKLKKESFMHSMVQNQNQQKGQQSKIQQTVHELQKSVLLIQKDLNIQAEEEDQSNRFDLSSILHRSMASLQQTPQENHKDQHNSSIVSEYNIDIHSNIKQYSNYVEQIDTISITKSVEESKNQSFKEQNPNFLQNNKFFKQKKENNWEIEQISEYKINSRQIENQDFNLSRKNNKSKEKQQKQQKFKQLSSSDKKQINYKDLGKPPMPKTVVKKKKKTLFSNKGTKNNQDLLGNLLQESYKSFIQQKS